MHAHATTFRRLVLCAPLLCASITGVAAQQPTPTAQPAAAPASRPEYERVVVTAGRSTVVPTNFNITRIAITDPTIADATVVQPREILIDGKKGGTVSLIVWSATDRKQYDVVVE